MRLTVIALLCPALILAQQPGAVASSPAAPGVIANDKTVPPGKAPNLPVSFWVWHWPYTSVNVPPEQFEPARRAGSLVRNGAIYLSLHDALALAIENNLDVEVARYELSIAGTEPQRASGGGNLRALDFSVAESPTGVGGPGSPLLNSAAATVTPTSPTVNDLTSLNILTETQSSLSVQDTSGFSAGPPVPVLDASLVGQSTFFQRSNAASLTPGALTSPPGSLNFITANYALVQGFGPGTQIEADLNNAAQVLYSNKSEYDPFSSPNASFTVTQPLMRGFGRSVNLRFEKIAQIDQRISRLVFYQQLISTVYGISRLYYDLVSLRENASVKRQALTAAQKLYADDKEQADQGTLAPIDLTQAQALVTSSQLDVIQADGLVRQQEVILKSQLSKRGSADPSLANLPIIPTDPIQVPDRDDLPTLDAIVQQALTIRPDLAQANLQVETGEVAVRASNNAVRPEIDIVGNFQTRGSSEIPFNTLGTAGTGLIASPADLGVAGLRLSRIYQAGVQINLPLRNRAAEADAARDVLQLRQAQVRTQRLANEVREQVENSVIALQTARSALGAATQSRMYQEQLVSAERDKLSVGASTNFLVVQQQAYLAQAQSTEVAARSVWIKARVALDRSIGDLLEKNGISYDDSVKGDLTGTH